MQKLFEDTRPLDKACIEKYSLTEDILMENAAAALEASVMAAAGKEDFPGNCGVLILCGSGDNGGDGYTLARRLSGKIAVKAVEVLAAKSPACIRQKERAEKAGVCVMQPADARETKETRVCGAGGEVPAGGLFEKAAVIVDCIFGSGFHGEPSAEIAAIISAANKSRAYRIACDVPSCLSSAARSSNAENFVFKADCTVTMGALKTLLYEDYAKDFTGKIVCAPLGVSSAVFESGGSEDAFLLETTDFCPPERKRQNTHKGTFGHGAVICGEKPGAGIIAATACFAFGAGLVTLVSDEGRSLLSKMPAELMLSETLPEKTTAFALGMGLGRTDNAFSKAEKLLGEAAEKKLPCVLDADIFYYPAIRSFLQSRSGSPALNSEKSQAKSSALCVGTVLTPHPKEFQQLWKTCGLGEISMEEILLKKRELSAEFCRKFPGIVLVLKGANPVISVYHSSGGTDDEISLKQYINPLGTVALAKGGSGDVLSGLICALLAQGYSALDASIQASLAHSLASRDAASSYGMTPFMLIDAVRTLKV